MVADGTDEDLFVFDLCGLSFRFVVWLNFDGDVLSFYSCYGRKEM